MKSLLMSILLFLPFVPATAQVSNCNTMIGGTAVTIPVPVARFTEVGSEKREYFEWLAPSGNRLLCAFVPIDILPRLKKPAGGMERYMLVETARAWDEGKTELTTADFEDIGSKVRGQLGDSTEMNRTVQASSEDLSRKLKAIDQSRDIALGQVTPLGVLFQKQNVFAFAMVLPVSSEGTTIRVINVSVLVRVRNRGLFAYIYSTGTDQGSLNWAQQTAQAWAQQILDANQ